MLKNQSSGKAENGLEIAGGILYSYGMAVLASLNHLQCLYYSDYSFFYKYLNGSGTFEMSWFSAKSGSEVKYGGMCLFGKINSMYLHGMVGISIEVEADVNDGLPGYSLVGYLASEVRESEDRVRTAIRNLHLSLPPKKVTINLSPADLRKEGTGFDLAIAAAVLTAYGLVPAGACENMVLIGELGLDGSVKSVPGVLAMTDWAVKKGFRTMVLPSENLREASAIHGIGLIGIHSLKELYDGLRGIQPLQEYERDERNGIWKEKKYEVDFSEVNGQAVLKRAAEIAASGRHNLLMIGPAGSGKTMVARRMPTILPGMERSEQIEVSKIYSVRHLLTEKEPLIVNRPFRSPHHTISAQALTGGGSRPKPGEISLASGGILFLDEIAEMGSSALESLRQPMEERQVTIARVYGSYCYPANFQLVAAMNPCRCGHYPDLSRCTCTPAQVRKYLSKISRPLLDRIDICVEASAVTYDEISRNMENEDSASIRKRVEAARRIQKERFWESEIRCNGEMNGSMIRKFCYINNEENRFLKAVFQDLKLSARIYDKILKVARTVADVEGHDEISHRDLCEAVSYIRVRQKYWNN